MINEEKFIWYAAVVVNKKQNRTAVSFEKSADLMPYKRLTDVKWNQSLKAWQKMQINN
ncbi:hypothetical protein [Pedobacter alluvionis]|uniref:Uncharacterized protein n=1 Tax=Pedobacter alluvionis TaxID=475253 RepID=A0A497YBE9_9SPHI|nr:hypothetical protein [Pedobacter alluvionis]RLJ79807.1 hypothetical protein BCL90_0517 [Pedobacter alluvionis]